MISGWLESLKWSQDYPAVVRLTKIRTKSPTAFRLLSLRFGLVDIPAQEALGFKPTELVAFYRHGQLKSISEKEVNTMIDFLISEL